MSELQTVRRLRLLVDCVQEPAHSAVDQAALRLQSMAERAHPSRDDTPYVDCAVMDYGNMPNAWPRLLLGGGGFVVSEFLGNLYKDISIGNSQKLVAYRYKRGGVRQGNLVLVDLARHADVREAVEAVVGKTDLLAPVGRGQTFVGIA